VLQLLGKHQARWPKGAVTLLQINGITADIVF
jgi:hypothetical protein